MTPDDTIDLTAAIQALIELDSQLSRDVSGERGEWHLSRVRKAMMTLMRLFPKEGLVALGCAKAPDGSELWAD